MWKVIFQDSMDCRADMCNNAIDGPSELQFIR